MENIEPTGNLTKSNIPALSVRIFPSFGLQRKRTNTKPRIYIIIFWYCKKIMLSADGILSNSLCCESFENKK